MNKERLIIILILALGVFVIYYLGYLNIYSSANIWMNDEREFSKPIDVVWRGEIISIMAGGSCVGLKGLFDKYDFALACLPDADSGELWKFEGPVTITGKWLGITCAYKNTIFGECVPNIGIQNIKQ